MFRFFLFIFFFETVFGYHNLWNHLELPPKEPFWMRSQGFLLDTKYALIVGIGDGVCLDNNYNDCQIIGLDINPKIYNMAKTKFPEKTIILGNIEESIFNPNSFDHIFLRIPVLHLKKKKKTIEQLYRILKKNGKLCVIDYDDYHPYRLELNSIPYGMKHKIEKDYKTNGIDYLKNFFILENLIVENQFKKYLFIK